MAGIFALIIAMVPPASPSLLFLSWGGGAAFAGVLYIFVMPHLSGFAGAGDADIRCVLRDPISVGCATPSTGQDLRYGVVPDSHQYR